jgi:hypothetical protein
VPNYILHQNRFAYQISRSLAARGLVCENKVASWYSPDSQAKFLKYISRMDFLDPKKRRHYHIRLYLGYFLVAVVIGLATVIIVYGANGYGINTKTGQIVQNGLLFVDSKPGGSEIYLNGSDQHSTVSARLVLPAGNYTLKLTKSGYHDWSRKFTLNEQSVARYVYPFLFPTQPRLADLKSYTAQPALITQSPDQKWLLVENPVASAKVPTFDEYDTSTLDKAAPSTDSLAFPTTLLTNYSSASVLTEVEWSTDNVHVLLRHDYPGGSEFIIFNRAKPDQSVNINTLLNISPSAVSLYNKGVAQLYIFNQADASVALANLGDKKIAKPFLTHVLAYKAYGKNIVTYITDSGEIAGQVAAKIWDNGQTYKLNEFAAGTTYLIDTAQFQGNFYYADGSNQSGRINIYKNPESDIKNPSIGKALPTIALHAPGATKLKFSNNTRFIGVESGQDFAVYDMETQTSYQYSLPDTLAADMDWMDGHRFIGEANGNILVMDYDGTNKQIIEPTALAAGGYFSGDYNHLLTIAPSDDKTAFILKDIDMRAGGDLPNK